MCISITTTRASTDLRREEARVPRRPLRRARMASTTRGHSIQRATLFHFKRRAAATPTRLSTTPHNRGTPFLPRTFNPPFTVPRFTPTTVPAAPTTTITTTASVSTWMLWPLLPPLTWPTFSTRRRGTFPKPQRLYHPALLIPSPATTPTLIPVWPPSSPALSSPPTAVYPTPASPSRNGAAGAGVGRRWRSTRAPTTRATKPTPSRATWRPTSEPTPEKSRTSAAGRAAAGGSPDLTSWPDTTGNTRATDPSSADSARGLSRDPTTWRCTWSDTSPSETRTLLSPGPFRRYILHPKKKCRSGFFVHIVASSSLHRNIEFHSFLDKLLSYSSFQSSSKTIKCRLKLILCVTFFSLSLSVCVFRRTLTRKCDTYVDLPSRQT